MIIIVNEDERISVEKTPGEDSIHIEIPQGRDRIHHVYVHDQSTVQISLEVDGIRVVV